MFLLFREVIITTHVVRTLTTIIKLRKIFIKQKLNHFCHKKLIMKNLFEKHVMF